MASAEALAELQRVLNGLTSRASGPLEKMPVEAPHVPQQETGRTDEPAALPDSANRAAAREAARTGRGSRRSTVERRRDK